MSQVAAPPRVTPTTAALLRCWFGNEAICLRGGQGFHAQQRRAILDTVIAHEAMNQHALWLQRPVHRLALTEGEHQIEVLLALLVWQLLNHHDTLAAGIEDVRFTHHFIVMAPHDHTRELLRKVFFGRHRPGGRGERDFHTSDLVRLSQLLIPIARQEEVHAFVRASVCSGARFTRPAEGHGVIAIADGRLEALECLARLPQAMVFDDETRPPYLAHCEEDRHGLAWRNHVRRFASARRGFGVQVVFTQPPAQEPGPP